MKKIVVIVGILLLSVLSFYANGQERVGPLRYHPVMSKANAAHKKTVMKTSASVLHLPFFEDFTGYSPYPDSNKWVDHEVYVNNTMCVGPISRGVVTFDDLDQNGLPYDTLSTTDTRYADSLTSQPIDLSLNVPGDSLYLSFFYQPQGNGFYPQPSDSLNLYIKNSYGDFILAWTTPGNTLQPFKQVLIPITDTLYFHSGFQFRFVNIAALNYADANWNVDYIRLDTNRNIGDSLISDIAFTSDPTFLLNDYTSMPYRQFLANPLSETATQYGDSINANNSGPFPDNYGYSAVALNTGTVLAASSISGSATFIPYVVTPLTFPAYTTTIPASSVGSDDRVVFENTYFIQPSPVFTGSSANDTIVKDQVFDNYLAYDDGTAEKSYYLNLSPTLDGRIAIEYHLNQPDTLRGFSIYFGRTAPLQDYKSFSILVYSRLAGVNGSSTEDTLYTQDYYSPGYIDTINHFWVYHFDHPVYLPAGTFYVGTMQYAESGDDSMYIGLDVNRIGSNHAYFNVLGTWEPSLISGALMMRPLLGQDFTASAVANVQAKQVQWHLSPNPANELLQVNFDGNAAAIYHITDITGHEIMKGSVANSTNVDIAALVPGMYLVYLEINGIPTTTQKVIKL